MNPNFSLPMRPHPRTRSTEDARDSHDSQAASNPQQNELKQDGSLSRYKASSPEAAIDAQQSKPKTARHDAFLQNGTLIPIVAHDHLREKAQLHDSSDDRAVKLSTSGVIAKQTSLLEMVRENLRHVRSQTPSPELKYEGVRSTSSSYPEQGMRSPSTPSPDLDVRIAKIDLGDLTRYSRTYDRLSALHSSSSSSGAGRIVSQGSTHRALTDAAAAFGQLHRFPTPSYHRFEIVSSSEDLTAHALAPQNSIASQTSLKDTIECIETHGLTRVKAQAQLGNQTDESHPGSPRPSIKPPKVAGTPKRKASSISLRGLTAGVKRSRVELEKLAYNVCHTSCYKLRQVRESIKRQRKEQKKQYSAWKALRRQLKPGDAIKGKHEKGFASFSIDKSRHGNESWWKAGVERYRAPKWMQFGK
ncbi:hypothetical protein HG530_015388 [Fusarium avenaceum]|nr:hypothetical protein HG530_015388 [Fusarium avenaceum]